MTEETKGAWTVAYRTAVLGLLILIAEKLSEISHWLEYKATHY